MHYKVIGLLKSIVLILPIVFITNVFGFFKQTEWLIPAAGLGSFWVADVFLIFALVLTFLSKRSMLNSRPLLLIYILIAFLILLALINFLEGYPFKSILNGFRGVAYFLLIIPIIYLINTEFELRLFIHLLLLYTFLCGLMLIFAFYEIIKLEGLYSNTLSDVYGFERVIRYYPAAEYLMDMMIFILISFVLHKFDFRKMFLYSIGLFILLFSALLTFTRSTYVLIIIGYSLITFLIQKKILKGFLISLVSITSIIFIISFLHGSDIYGGIIRLVMGAEETRQGSGNIAGRYEILLLKVNATLQSNPIFGRGFNWGPNPTARNIDFNPLARSNHNGYASIFVIGGFTCVILFISIFYQIIKNGFQLHLSLEDKFLKSVILGITIFNILINIKAMVTDPYTDATGSAVFALGWGILIKISSIYSNYDQGNILS